MSHSVQNLNTELMGLDKSVREQAERTTRLLVGGKPVDPWLVAIDLEATRPSSHLAELRLGLPILFFEMKQYEIIITNENAVQFVSDNIKKYGHEALDVYLTIVRHVVNPPPRRKSYTWFARMFTSPPSWTPPQPQWKFTSVTEVALSEDDALLIKGTCSDADKP